MAMYRLSNQKACFLKKSTSELPKPSDLKDLLDKVRKFVYRFGAGIAEYPATDLHFTELELNSVYCILTRSYTSAAKFKQSWQGIQQLLVLSHHPKCYF